MTLSPKQSEFILSILDGLELVHLGEGAVRSGKTMTSILAWCEWCRIAPPGPFLMIGKTRDTIRRNVLDEIDAYFGDDSPLEHTKGANEGTLFGRKIHIVGANDAKAESRIRGVTSHSAYVDELTLLPGSDFWSMLALRHATIPHAKIIATTNPDSPMHWVRQLIMNNPDSNARVTHFDMSDNPLLSDEAIEKIRKSQSPLWWKRFGLGLWVSAEGAIFESWDQDRHVVRHADLPEMQTVYSLGVDYGSRENARGILIGLGTDPTDGITRLYVIDEWAPGKAAMSQHSEDLRDWLDERPEPTFIHYDPAAKAFGDQIRFDGLDTATKAKNDVISGIRVVDSLIASDRLRVSDRATNLIGEIPGYAWDEKAQNEGEDRPVKENDHACDALRYAVFSTRNLWRYDISPN